MPYFCLLLESVSRSYRALFIVQPVFDCILSAFIISYPCTRASTQVFIFLPSFISVSFISIRKLGDNMPYLFRFIFEDYNPILIESFELLNPSFESFSPRLFSLLLIFEKNALYLGTLVSGQFFPFHYTYEQYFILDSLTTQEFSLPFRGTSTFIRCQIKFSRAFLT